VDRAVGGGPIILPDGAFGACATERMESRHRWDPAFDLDSSLKTRSVTGVRAGGAAERAGLRNGMKILGASVQRGDPARNLVLRVQNGDVQQQISYLPASAESVEVQQWSVAPNCALAR
jgi:predicted metalloprotease with PDZ domain